MPVTRTSVAPAASLKSLVAIAISYALRRWSALTRYLDDGRLETDNLVAERALQGVVIGAQLAVRQITGGRRASRAIYSIIERCKLNGVRLITDVLQKIAEGRPNSRIDELRPWARSQTAQQQAA